MTEKKNKEIPIVSVKQRWGYIHQHRHRESKELVRKQK